MPYVNTQGITEKAMQDMRWQKERNLMAKMKNVYRTLQIATTASACITILSAVFTIGAMGGLERDTLSIPMAVLYATIGIIITIAAATLTARLQDATEYINHEIKIRKNHRHMQRCNHTN